MDRLPLLAALLAAVTSCSPPNDEGMERRMVYQHLVEGMEWGIPAGATRDSVEHEGVKYSAEYSSRGTGGCVTAFDTSNSQQLWTRQLSALGQINTEKYLNEIWLKPFGDDAISVYGRESYGRYIEMLDRKTGEPLGHKVFMGIEPTR